MGGVSESQLPMGRWYLLNVKGTFPREMRYHWTLLRARWEGLKVGRDGVKDVAGHFVLSLRRERGLYDLVT